MNKAKIRQQGFNDHGGGYEIYDNPFTKGSLHYSLWEEDWGLRASQLDMFDKLDLDKEPDSDEDDSFASFAETVCPHCGMSLKVILE